MGPHGYYWFSLETDRPHDETTTTPELKASSWKSLWGKRHRKKLETQILPAYPLTQDWFGGRSRIMQGIEVRNSMDIPAEGVKVRLLLVVESYNDGLPEWYQLPVAFSETEAITQSESLQKHSLLAKLELGNKRGYLLDAVYDQGFRVALFKHFKKTRKRSSGEDALRFHHHKKAIPKGMEGRRSKVLEGLHTHTAIAYEQDFYLKLYRNLDTTVNPDLEIVQYLNEKTDFEQSPKYTGSMRYSTADGSSIVLGMLQEQLPNHGNAWDYTRDTLHRYFERVLVTGKEHPLPPDTNSPLAPLRYERLPESMKALLGSVFPERIMLLGQRTAEMHKALAANPNLPDFSHEPFSLHYQRSVFSSLQGLTRSTFENLQKSLKGLPEECQEAAKEVLGKRQEVLQCFRRIFAHKIPTVKIRTHGDYHLHQLLWTGRDFVIRNFEGEPMRPFSERRLKRSPLRDVAAMLRSLNYAAFTAIKEQEFDRHRREGDLDAWAEAWAEYSSRLFLQGYSEHVGDYPFIPESVEDFNILLDTFLLEKAVYELNYELDHRPEQVMIPMRGVLKILRRSGLNSH